MKNLHYISPPLPGLNALSCSNDFAFEKHIHSGHVLWLNSEGGEQYQIQGQSSILQPGTISVIEPGVVHSNQPSVDGKRHLRSLYLEEDFFRYLEQLFSGTATDTLSLPTKVFNDKKCWKDALLLHESVITKQEKLFIQERAVNLFINLADRQSTSRLKKSLFSAEDKRIDQIVAYMKSHLATEVSLNTLGSLVQCTPFHVIRLFKNTLAMSPHAYFIQLRLERARDLIGAGYNLTDAALLAGFSDQSHLTRRFKKRYGVTPGKYKEQKNC